jgi:uncharacterized membrane-anchored protein YitT (DUF2179 family)
MKNAGKIAFWTLRIIVGTSIFALGFDLFLIPNALNVGGLSGLAMVLVHVLGFGSVGMVTTLVNLPLFIIGGRKIGKTFFTGSLIGMLSLSVAIDAFTILPVPNVEPLIAVLYGAALCGVGAGIVFVAGASTGGSDIVVRLLKMRYQHIPIGTITMCFDAVVAILTGLVFQDVSRALYSGIAIFVTGTVLDAVVYRFDYSKVAIIISKEYETIAREIGTKLNRGSTYLYGQGVYKGEETKVVLTAVKRQQIAELKALVSEIDPNAFIIVQEAHQVLGDGFSRYSKHSL